LLFALCSLISFGSAQSFFSSRGFGEEMTYSDAASGALGGLFTASTRNPAYPLGTSKTNFTASALALGNLASDDSGHYRALGDVRPDYLKVRVPLPAGLRLGLGLSEWFNQDFDVYSDSYPAFRRHVVSKGGVYDLNGSVAASLFKTVSIAAEYNRLFGGSSELWRFDAFEGNYATFDTIQYSYAGDALTFGLYAQRWVVGLGGFYQPVLDFNLNSWVKTHGSVSESTIAEPVEFPARYGAGLVISPTASLKVFLEGSKRDAGQLTIGDSTRPEFHNSLEGVLGVQYMLDEVHPLRLGARWNNWYMSDAAGTPVREIAVTGGSSFPIAGLGSFDFSVEYMNRSGATIHENVVRAGLTLYFEEPWKARKRRWGY
jgi:hypothetical protein